ncbi:MAG: CCA tRNA nucleotidyltransferase [Asgard group archaeon]|nr:CCA tRNA nucleotidyltransferase [Asgard group archaeon]
MDLNEQYEKISLEVLEKIRPKKDEREKLKKSYQEIVKKLDEILLKNNIPGEVKLSGSFSRDTWLSGNRDIDLFIILPYDSELKLEEILEAIKKDFKLKWVKMHAKHPYLYAVYEGIEIEIIPCYKFQPNRAIRSAVDRTQKHMEFIEQNLPIGTNEEVRLLKQFLRGVGAYGAEIKIKGFSGYLTELLIIHHNGNFIDVLKHASKLGTEIISFKEGLEVDPERFKDDTIIIIDPVDDNRNVASALNEHTLAKFIAAANAYLNKPSIDYFFSKPVNITKGKIKEMENSPITFTAIILPFPEISYDILWGQLRRFEKSVKRLLSKEGVKPIIIDSTIINNEIMTIIITLEKTTPPYKWKIGPLPHMNAQKEFLEAHINNTEVIYGPLIIDGRWKLVEKQKKFTIEQLIKNGLEKNEIVKPSHLNLKKLEILAGKDLIEKIIDNNEKLVFLYQLLKGKPPYIWNK